MVSKAAENNTASGTIIRKTAAIAPALNCSGRSMPPNCSRFCSSPRPASNVAPMEIIESIALRSDAVSTIRNFPRTRCTRETGLHRIVSIVPRSFSPAVRSMAGYMAPIRHSTMTK